MLSKVRKNIYLFITRRNEQEQEEADKEVEEEEVEEEEEGGLNQGKILHLGGFFFHNAL